MHKTEPLKEVIEEELCKLGKKAELTPNEMDYAYKAAKALYYMEVTKAMQGEEEYSERGGSNRSYGSYANSMYPMPYAFARGGSNAYDSFARGGSNAYDSFARGGGSNAYDSYAQGGGSNAYDSYEGNSSARRRRYSRGDEREVMIEKLEDMMDDAVSKSEKETIQRCINKMQRD